MNMSCAYYYPYIGKLFELQKKTTYDNNHNKTLSIQGMEYILNRLSNTREPDNVS